MATNVSLNHEAKAKWEREQLLRRNPDWKVARADTDRDIFYAKVKEISTKLDGLVF